MNYDDVLQLFDTLNIGKIQHLDIRRKINEQNQEYQFAFVRFEPYNTIQGLRVVENLSKNISTRLTYDPNSQSIYLEIKPYLSFDQRTTVQSLCRELLEIVPDRAVKNHTAFDTISEEYDALQKEIDDLMAAPVYSIWTTPLLFVQ
jgi:hypothetical protein